ncbi:MAG: TonB-dependent receptor [Dokdonella sp.]
MRLPSSELCKAVRYALYAGASAVVGLTAAPVLAQDQDASSSEKLETVVVTGSRIRRVDIENASPVFVVDRAQIEKSGKLTIGDLLQETPSIAGAATNPQVNNGGGTGAATVSLRGLGSQRTLLLIDGRRVIYNDVNSIPASMVERIEILKDGASAIYGSDAIGGVVNFIMRKNYQGVEASASYGISDRDDGQRQGFSMTMGQTSDRGSVVINANYNKQENVAAANRKFSEAPLYNYFGSVFVLGSGTIPNGRFVIPRTVAVGLGLSCPGTAANVSVTRVNGAAGNTGTDFRCYIGNGPGNDTFNFQAAGNQELTPQERGGIFVNGNYRITDNIEAYVQVIYQKTTSHQAIAPLPLIFGVNSGVFLTADSIYNPFGVTVGSGGRRMSDIGNRASFYDTTFNSINGGLRGNFGESWTWDFNVQWGRLQQNTITYGHFFNLALARATGPSFIDAGGVARCGSPGAVISGCTPINLFGDFNTPAGQQSLAALRALQANTTYHFYSTQRIANLDFAGNLFDLPAGPVGIAFGTSYQQDYQYYRPDFTAQITDPTQGTCLTDVDSCASSQFGTLSNKEVYAEVLIPILKDVPFAKALNVSIGSRYSDYSAFGTTTNSKISVEWRPIEDLLVRGTAAEVFRSPTISDLFGGITPSADTYNDPCSGIALPNSNPACAGLAPGFQQTTAQTNSLQGSNVNLQPETGRVYTYGFVYDPSWLPGLTTSVDLWRVTLHDTIGSIGTQTIINQCFNFGQFCNLFTRDLAGIGDINLVNNTTQNIGRLDTNGVDIGIKYRLPEMAWGNFRVGLDATYIQTYNNEVIEGDGTTSTHAAGTYFGSASGGDGNFSRWRALGSIDWSLGAFDASLRTRFVSRFRFGNQCQTPSGYQLVCPTNDPTLNFFSNGFKAGAYTIHNVQFGYNLDALNTRIEVGVDNVGDKQPPLLYQYGFNGSTDERTFDTVGRYYWTRINVKF